MVGGGWQRKAGEARGGEGEPVAGRLRLVRHGRSGEAGIRGGLRCPVRQARLLAATRAWDGEAGRGMARQASPVKARRWLAQ